MVSLDGTWTRTLAVVSTAAEKAKGAEFCYFEGGGTEVEASATAAGKGSMLSLAGS